jgi:hypothetical protein
LIVSRIRRIRRCAEANVLKLMIAARNEKSKLIFLPGIFSILLPQTTAFPVNYSEQGLP